MFVSDNERRIIVMGPNSVTSVGAIGGPETEAVVDIRQGSNGSFSPDGSIFGRSSGLGSVRLWETAGFREIGTLTGFMMGTFSVVFSPDGHRIAVGGTGIESMTTWGSANREMLLRLETEKTRFASTAFSADGNNLASAASDGTLHLWRAPSFAEIEEAEAAEAAKAAGIPRN